MKQLMIGAVLAVGMMSIDLAAAPQSSKTNGNTYPKIVVEPDQTDIYAIPLDEDADEQQEELNSFENYKK